MITIERLQAKIDEVKQGRDAFQYEAEKALEGFRASIFVLESLLAELDTDESDEPQNERNVDDEQRFVREGA